mmetsp:Transcript_15360/g.25053  ORF Transcript_15360/g.25053 Transcript_15360/m.25053 type:complete len:202 (+) Transcript_15360:2312-2917(+)
MTIKLVANTRVVLENSPQNPLWTRDDELTSTLASVIPTTQNRVQQPKSFDEIGFDRRDKSVGNALTYPTTMLHAPSKINKTHSEPATRRQSARECSDAPTVLPTPTDTTTPSKTPIKTQTTPVTASTGQVRRTSTNGAPNTPSISSLVYPDDHQFSKIAHGFQRSTNQLSLIAQLARRKHQYAPRLRRPTKDYQQQPTRLP